MVKRLLQNASTVSFLAPPTQVPTESTNPPGPESRIRPKSPSEEVEVPGNKNFGDTFTKEAALTSLAFDAWTPKARGFLPQRLRVLFSVVRKAVGSSLACETCNAPQASNCLADLPLLHVDLP